MSCRQVGQIMTLTEDEIKAMLEKRELNDSEHRVLVFLEPFGILELPLTSEKRKELPNASKIAGNTGLVANTVSEALKRLNIKGLIVYSRYGMQKHAVLTGKGMAVVEFWKSNNPQYYELLKARRE